MRWPIVWILHLAYLWLPIGLALKAAFLFGGFPWAAHWQHALGAGAAGSMILAVMTRASLGHTGRPLRAHPVTALAYLVLTWAPEIEIVEDGADGGAAGAATPAATDAAAR